LSSEYALFVPFGTGVINDYLFITGWSRPCSMTRIRVFVMQLVNACTYQLSSSFVDHSGLWRTVVYGLGGKYSCVTHPRPTGIFLITDFFCLVQEFVREKYDRQLFAALIPTLEAPEPRFVIRHYFPTFIGLLTAPTLQRTLTRRRGTYHLL
jgi:hypothetical protein